MEQIIITHKDGKKELLNSASRLSGITKAEQKVALLGADTVSISINTATPLNIEIGSTIEVYGRIYTLNLLPVIKRTGTRKFTYDLTFEGVQYELIDIQFLLDEETIGDSFTGNLEAFLKLWIANVARVMGNKWALGEYPKDTEYMTLSFTGKNCLEVAQELCEKYGKEFEITQSNGIRTFHVRTAGANFPFTFRYGKTGGLYELTRKNVNSKNVVTRLYVYGGSNNLGNSYRYSKLCLPGLNKNKSYIEDAAAIAVYGVKENTKNYDKIFPNRYGQVTAKGSTYYAFIDNTMNFDLNEKDSAGNTKWLINGVTGKIKMTTGNLAGYEFDIHKYTHSTKEIQVVPFTDENGFKFPSETSAAFQFGKDDKYIFTNINLPDQYKTDAEAELLVEGKADYAKLSQPQVEYGLNIDQNFIKQFAGQLTVVNLFDVGDFIPVVDEEIGVNKSIRITGYTRDLIQEYKYSLTLGDSLPTDITTRVISDLREIERVIDINQLADPASARRRWRATQEVLSMVFDPDGDYYTDKIKPGSIETMMLQSGARSMQFVLQNVIFQPNYEGNPNYIRVSAGKLVHYTIEENIRTWDIAQLSISNLVSATAYYVYARCSIAGTAGSILVEATQRKVDHEAGYYNFLVGVLNSVEADSDGSNPARLLSLMYGSSTMNGRFIKTGRIESSGGGNTYFDLDNGEIGGRMVFNDGLVSGLIGIGNANGINGGMSGEGTAASNVRIWIGAATANRTSAPYRVLHDGSFIATKAQIEGVIKAISGEIGGFSFASGRIGATKDLESDSYKGLGLYNDMIKFSDSDTWVGMGINVLPGSSGNKSLARMEYTGSSYPAAYALRLKMRPSYTHQWYVPRALYADGNIFTKGGHCLLDDTYIGQAYTDIIEVYIAHTTQYTFTSISSSLLGIDLPSRSNIQSSLASGNSYTFLLHITIAASTNKIRLRSVSGGQIKNNNGGNVEYIDMAYGDILILRYYNGNYYQIAHRQ